MLGRNTTVELYARPRCEIAGLWPKPKSLVVPLQLTGLKLRCLCLSIRCTVAQAERKKSYVNKGLRTCSSWFVRPDSLLGLIPAPDISAVEHNLATSHAYAPVGSCVIVLTLRDQKVLLLAHQPTPVG